MSGASVCLYLNHPSFPTVRVKKICPLHRFQSRHDDIDVSRTISSSQCLYRLFFFSFFLTNTTVTQMSKGLFRFPGCQQVLTSSQGAGDGIWVKSFGIFCKEIFGKALTKDADTHIIMRVINSVRVCAAFGCLNPGRGKKQVSYVQVNSIDICMETSDGKITGHCRIAGQSPDNQ